MLHNVKSLIESKVLLGDTQTGTIKDIFFDDRDWAIRYFLVRTGGWLNRKSVLISPTNVCSINWEKRSVSLSLTQYQFLNSPTLESHFFDYYHWPYYWTGAGIWGVAATSEILRDGIPPDPVLHFAKKNQKPDQKLDRKVDQKVEKKRQGSCLRSIVGTLDYRAEASDADLGFVEDFIFDSEHWVIRYIAVDARTLWPDRTVVFSPQWIKSADWDQLVFKFRFSEEFIKSSPKFNPEIPMDAELEKELWTYYMRSGHRLHELVYRKII